MLKASDLQKLHVLLAGAKRRMYQMTVPYPELIPTMIFLDEATALIGKLLLEELNSALAKVQAETPINTNDEPQA